MSAIISLLVGIIFGVGLIIAQMTNPSKIIGFLTFGENWDPSLLFVDRKSTRLNSSHT